MTKKQEAKRERYIWKNQPVFSLEITNAELTTIRAALQRHRYLRPHPLALTNTREINRILRILPYPERAIRRK